MMDGAHKTGGIRYPFAAPPEPGGATEIAPGVLWMRVPLPMALDHVNVYALDDGCGWTVIDTGFDNRESRAIWDDLMAGPLGGRPVWRVIATHHHPDHIGLAGWFQQDHGAELWTTRTSWLMARMLVLDVQDAPCLETLDFWRGAGMDAGLLARRAAERPFNFADMVVHLPLGYRRILAGERLLIGGRHWDVHFGHGHAPDHATFWEAGGDLVIGGDQLLPSISPNLGVFATEPDADPVGDWIESCERFVPLAHEDHLVLPGHKLPFTGLPFRLRQKIDNHHGALARLLAHLDRPRVATECFPALFKRTIDEGTYGLAMVEAVAHLNHLLHQGQITRSRRDDGAWLWERGG
jgi:glyoxylase-like metal-dependent hydrolase (beta-lactamase superfamily II)